MKLGKRAIFWSLFWNCARKQLPDFFHKLQISYMQKTTLKVEPNRQFKVQQPEKKTNFHLYGGPIATFLKSCFQGISISGSKYGICRFSLHYPFVVRETMERYLLNY